MKQLITSLICIVLLASALVSNAQSNFKEGYILITEFDTVFGWVEANNYVTNSHVCNFKSTNEGEVKLYSPSSIFGYRFVDGKYYVSKQIERSGITNTVFLEYLFKGSLSFYFYMGQDKKGAYFVSKAEYGLEELKYGEEIKVVDGETVQSKKKPFLGVLSLFTFDCKSVQADVNKMERPSHKSLIKLGEKYQQNCGAGDSESNFTKVEKKGLLLSIGGRNSRYFNGQGDYYYVPSYSFRVFISDLSVSESVFFGLGLRYQDFEKYTGYPEFKWGIPVSINYIKNKNGISPIVGYEIVLSRLTTQNVYLGAKYQLNRWNYNLFVDAHTHNFVSVIAVSMGVRLDFRF